MSCDHVWIKDWSAAPLKPWRKGPQTMILTTPTAIKNHLKKDNKPCSSHIPEARWSTHGRSMRKFIVGLVRLNIWTCTIGTLTNFEECPQCVHHVTKIGRKVTAILLSYSYYECTGTHTQYKVCNPGDGQPDVCYDLSELPKHMTFKIKLLTGR
ncbi:hypothetical protein AAY473_011980 [Plecturocebus cupreus]